MTPQQLRRNAILQGAVFIAVFATAQTLIFWLTGA
jgi:hypothetical protein